MGAFPAQYIWLLDQLVGRAARDPDPEVLGKRFDFFLKMISEKDRKTLENPAARQLMVKIFRENWRQGRQGWVQEVRHQSNDPLFYFICHISQHLRSGKGLLRYGHRLA